MPRLSVQRLFDDKRERLGLAWAAGLAGAGDEINGDALTQSGIGLIGHLNLIHPVLVQVMGKGEVEYLAELDADARDQAVGRIFDTPTICVLVCDGVPVPDYLERAATRYATPLISSTAASQLTINILRPYLQSELGAVTTMHGVFLDVLEIGVMITGDPSIGKSELALELISRGHGLVADDAVEMQQIGPETVTGRCPPMLRDFLEVRGLGILNIRSIFGETAVRPRKTLRLIVSLESPVDGKYDVRDRLQPRAGTQSVLGVPIPTVTLVVAPGRNLAVLVEAAVRNHILLTRGIDSTRELIARHADAVRADADKDRGKEGT